MCPARRAFGLKCRWWGRRNAGSEGPHLGLHRFQDELEFLREVGLVVDVTWTGFGREFVPDWRRRPARARARFGSCCLSWQLRAQGRAAQRRGRNRGEFGAGSSDGGRRIGDRRNGQVNHCFVTIFLDLRETFHPRFFRGRSTWRTIGTANGASEQVPLSAFHKDVTGISCMGSIRCVFVDHRQDKSGSRRGPPRSPPPGTTTEVVRYLRLRSHETRRLLQCKCRPRRAWGSSVASCLEAKSGVDFQLMPSLSYRGAKGNSR